MAKIRYLVKLNTFKVFVKKFPVIKYWYLYFSYIYNLIRSIVIQNQINFPSQNSGDIINPLSARFRKVGFRLVKF